MLCPACYSVMRRSCSWWASMHSRSARAPAAEGRPSGRASSSHARSAQTPWPTIVRLNLRDLEAMFNGRIRALAKALVFGTKVSGIADGTDLETTEHGTECG